MYIYKITNMINGKVYIGQSTKSITESLDYYGSGILIQNAIKKYGIENFDKSILCKCDTKTELDEMERYYISKYKSTDNGYNISEGGNGGNLGDIVNSKISNTIKNQWKNGKYDSVKWSDRPPTVHTEESISKIRNSQIGEKGYWYGKKLSDEHKEKIKINTKKAYENPIIKQKFIRAMRSKKVRDAISNALKGNEPWNKGKTGVYTEEQRKRMSESAKNRNIDDDVERERRKKISKYLSENHPTKIQILDTRSNKLYDSLKQFCDENNVSWYRTKKMRKDGIIQEVNDES